MLFANGGASVFGDDHEHYVPLPSSWLLSYIETLRAEGIEVDEQTELVLPNGRSARLFRTSDGGWNWNFL